MSLDLDDLAGDLRNEEIETLKAIYPDFLLIDIASSSGVIRIPLETDIGISVHLLNLNGVVIRTSQVKHLPPIEFSFTLPVGYPYENPPEFELSSLVISTQKTQELALLLALQWIDTRDQVLFSMIDLLHQKASELEDLLGSEITCGDVKYEQIIEYDLAEAQRVFDEATFTCEICQNDRKGAECSAFDCGHIFCNVCLRDFFVSLINSGEVEKIHCPDFGCGKKFLEAREKCLRLDFLESSKFDFKEFQTQLMTPPISLSILQKIFGKDEIELYNRYLSLFTKHQNAVIAKLFPARLVSCPRENCPAMIFREDMTSRLVICRTCDYAFCNNCRKSYHSGSIDCVKKKSEKQYFGIPTEALDRWLLAEKHSKERDILRYKYGTDLLVKVSHEYEMDKLFNEMILDASQGFAQCPTCDMTIQRLEGCNKMKCKSCATFFCNLCGMFLDYDHPYDHFNNPDSSCYGKLFHGMPGVE